MNTEYKVIIRHLNECEAKLITDIVELPTFPPTLFKYATVQQIKCAKRFIGIWGEGHMKNTRAKTEKIDSSFICASNGYSAEFIDEVESLVIGESLNIVELGAVHSIVRIQ